jgi:LuxR family maltose regulon positive regulatory protein
VRGHLTEIRAEKLRFEEDEASQYLGQHLSPALSSEEVHKLVGRTEGWIAGLHLVVLAMQKCEDRTTYLETLTGSQRYLLDYMQEDILAHLSSQVRDFLLQSAILSHLDASVCQAVTTTATRVASQQMLAFLERMNLFLIPLDEERHKYRLHELFREALLSILHTTQPELVPILHQRAASFYEAEGQWTEAITHRFKGRDFSAAAHLMERTVEQFWVRGEAEAMTHWALALPQSVVQEHASLLLTTALYHLATGMTTPQVQRERRHAEVQQLMTRVETALQQDIHPISPVERDLIQRRLRLLHLYLILNEVGASADFERLYSVQQEIQEALDGEEETIWQIAPLWASFMLHSIIWQAGARLLPQLFSARERLPRTANLFTVIKIRQWLAMTAVEAGQLHLATQESQAVLNLIEQITGYASLKGYFQIVLAQVFYQWNRIEDVRSLLHTVIQAATPWQHLDLLGRGYTGLLQVALATGDGALAEVSLHKMEELVQREHFETYPSMLPALRAHYWLMNGQIEAASGWATNIILIDGPWEKGTYDAFPIIVRVYFAQRNFREALALLERWSVHLDRPTNIRITITYLAQLLVALYQIGKLEQAYKIATRLFALTEPEGYLRVYLDEGEPMREALLALLTSHSQQGNKVYIAKLLAAFEDEAQHSATGSPLQQVAYSLSPRDTFLTRREQEVLHLLATGASNQDIAQALVISLPTVKKHVSNLLSKLGATSRVQIIAQAHTRSLFPIDSSQ